MASVIIHFNCKLFSVIQTKPTRSCCAKSLRDLIMTGVVVIFLEIPVDVEKRLLPSNISLVWRPVF